MITFENNNDGIVYALEKIINYARKHQYIFVAQSDWWLASIVRLTEGLIVHIDDLNKQTNIIGHGVSTIPRDLQEEARSPEKPERIHPNRLIRIQDIVHDIGDQKDLNLESRQQSKIVESTG